MQINLSVQSLCSHTLHDDLLARVMNDADIVSADLAHFSRGNLFILQPSAVGPGAKKSVQCNTGMPTMLHSVCFTHGGSQNVNSK